MVKKTRNKFEKKIERQLRKAKAKFKYESEKLPYHFVGHYIPDFVVSSATSKWYLETKGYLRPEHKRKMVAVKRLHPTLDIRILFYSKKTKDIRWAEKHGFPYAIENIPKEWLNDL